jgi:hypothetical protein
MSYVIILSCFIAFLIYLTITNLVDMITYNKLYCYYNEKYASSLNNKIGMVLFLITLPMLFLIENQFIFITNNAFGIAGIFLMVLNQNNDENDENGYNGYDYYDYNTYF